MDAGITAVKSSIAQLHDEQKKWHAASAEELKVATSTVRTNIAQMHDEQKRWHKASAEELKVATTTGLAGVTNAGQELATQAEKIAAAASDVEGTKTAIKDAVKNLTETGQAQITQIGNATKSKIDTAAEALAKETKKIGSVMERLSSPRPDPKPDPDPRRSQPFDGRSVENRGDSIGVGAQVRSAHLPQPTVRAPEETPVPVPVHHRLPEQLQQIASGLEGGIDTDSAKTRNPIPTEKKRRSIRDILRW